MFPRTPLKEINIEERENRMNKIPDFRSIINELNKIFSNISKYKEARYYGPFPNSNDIIPSLQFFDKLFKKLLKHNKKQRRTLRSRSKSILWVIIYLGHESSEYRNKSIERQSKAL